MSTPLTDSIQNLTSYINEVTGGEDTTLSDAVATLADGYGGISIGDVLYGGSIAGDIVSNTPRISPYALYGRWNVTSIRDDSTTQIYPHAFDSCSALRSIYFPNLTTFAQSSGCQFTGCSHLTDVYIPKITEISANCFSKCYALTTIKLPSCNKINVNAFDNCSALTDIYLPNDESTYTGAPWGATNATIHYNTQFDENGEPILE